MPEEVVRIVTGGPATRVLPVGDGSELVVTATGSDTGRTLADWFGADAVYAEAFDTIDAAITYALSAALPLILKSGEVYETDGEIAISASLSVFCPGGEATIRRSASSTEKTVFVVSGGVFRAEGVRFDGNKANNSNKCSPVIINATCTELSLVRCAFVNGQLSSDYGDGLLLAGAGSSSVNYTIDRCEFSNNDGKGISAADIRNFSITNNHVFDNGRTGIFLNNYDLTLAQKIEDGIVAYNRIHDNGQSGIHVGNLLADNDFSASLPLYGHDDPVASRVSIVNNQCIDNTQYGITVAGDDIVVEGNVCKGNGGSSSVYGGIGFGCRYSKLSGNVCRGNSAYGIDAGGAYVCSIEDNDVVSNGNTSGIPGLNVGGTTDVFVGGNKIHENGGTTGRQIKVHRTESDASGVAFPGETTGLVINGNDIWLSSNRVGIDVLDGCPDVEITNNIFRTPSQAIGNIALCIYFNAKAGRISGNKVRGSAARVVTISSNAAYIPEVLEEIEFNSTDTVNTLRWHTDSIIGAQGIAYCDVTAGGSGYTSAPTVSFSGGSGSGAAATAMIDGNGEVVAIRMTNYGSGYTSAPTVSFSGGDGSGATATATVRVPFIAQRMVQIHCYQAQTIARAGSPVVDSVATADISMNAKGTLSLRALSGQWRLTSIAN